MRLAALLAAPALAHDAGDIEVREAYAVASRPNAPSGAAFMVIRNGGRAPDRLVSASSPAAAAVALHTHVIDADGVARMMGAEDGFRLPRTARSSWSAAAAHLMFLGIADPFEDGDTVPVTLASKAAGEVAVEVPVDLDRLGGRHGAAPAGHAS